MPTMKELGLDKLNADERRALAEELVASLVVEIPPPSALPEALRTLLEQRVAEDDADPDGGIPWDEAYTAALARAAARRA